MSLTGEDKKEYQRNYMRKRQGTKNPRAGLITPGSNKTGGSNIRPDESDVETSAKRGGAPLSPKQGELAMLRGIIDNPSAPQSTSSPVKPAGNTNLPPRYNPAVHKPGDVVRMPDGQVVTIPFVDADGNETLAVPTFSSIGHAPRYVRPPNTVKPDPTKMVTMFPKPPKREKKLRK